MEYNSSTFKEENVEDSRNHFRIHGLQEVCFKLEIHFTMESDDLFSKEEIEKVYAWVDQIPLTRPKKNINRDFSDGGYYLQ